MIVKKTITLHSHIPSLEWWAKSKIMKESDCFLLLLDEALKEIYLLQKYFSISCKSISRYPAKVFLDPLQNISRSPAKYFSISCKSISRSPAKVFLTKSTVVQSIPLQSISLENPFIHCKVKWIFHRRKYLRAKWCWQIYIQHSWRGKYTRVICMDFLCFWI